MSGATYFVQDCPVCGRYLQVRLELLGKTVCCRHCRGSFIARDRSLDKRNIRAPELRSAGSGERVAVSGG